MLRINKTGAGTLKIASTSGNQAEDAPRLDKLEITKMQMPKYEGENRFSFPTELNAATPATLEAEYGIITNVITTEDENGNYPAQEKMDNDRGKDPWTGNRYFLTSVNTGDSVAMLIMLKNQEYMNLQQDIEVVRMTIITHGHQLTARL